MATTTTPMRAALGVLILCALLTTSCALTRQSMDIDYNNQRLNDGLERLVDRQQSARLSDFTAWNWDEVHLFHEHTNREFMEETVGAPVIRSKFYDSDASLLVFEDDGKPVKAIGVSGDPLRGEDHRVSWPADVMLEPFGTGALQLTLPPAPGT